MDHDNIDNVYDDDNGSIIAQHNLDTNNNDNGSNHLIVGTIVQFALVSTTKLVLHLVSSSSTIAMLILIALI